MDNDETLRLAQIAYAAYGETTNFLAPGDGGDARPG